MSILPEIGLPPAPWRWALFVSLVVHLLIVSQLEFLWHSEPLNRPPRPLTLTLDLSAPLILPNQGHAKESSVPTPVLSHVPLPVSVPGVATGPIDSKVPVGLPAPTEQPANAQPQLNGEPLNEEPSHSLVWRSLGMAQKMVSDPWAGRRVLVLNQATVDSDWRAYEEAFSAKVSDVGAVNYPPPEQGRPLTGAVRVVTVLNADGSLAAVEILQSSGQPALDRAALHIVRMAAPYLPFGESMRAHMDLVKIVRTFNFVRAGEALSSH